MTDKEMCKHVKAIYNVVEHVSDYWFYPEISLSEPDVDDAEGALTVLKEYVTKCSS
jgi:hypothetical protein